MRAIDWLADRVWPWSEIRRLRAVVARRDETIEGVLRVRDIAMRDCRAAVAAMRSAQRETGQALARLQLPEHVAQRRLLDNDELLKDLTDARDSLFRTCRARRDQLRALGVEPAGDPDAKVERAA